MEMCYPDSLTQILEILDDLKVRYKYHSWTNTPSDHCFATWFIPSESFDGADNMAMYENYKVNIAFYYRDTKKDADFVQERTFEEACRGAGTFSKSNGYDANNDLFTTVYTFNFKQFLA